MSMKKACEKKLQSLLDEWSAEAGAQLGYYRQTEELRSMQDAAGKYALLIRSSRRKSGNGS